MPHEMDLAASGGHAKPRRSENRLSDANFPLLDFLIFWTLMEREKYSLEVVEALSRIDLPIHTPCVQVIYMHLKNLVRDELLTSRTEFRRVYFSPTQKGRDRFKAICTLTRSLNELARTVPKG